MKTHCLSKSTGDMGRAYATWRSMRSRCNSQVRPNYRNYGGRGIGICERWNDFTNFLVDMGLPPKGMTIDRISNDDDYSPENCRWSTAKEQNNNKRNNWMITAYGLTLNMSQWSERTGISEDAIWVRLKRGWTEEKAVGTPARIRKTEQRVVRGVPPIMGLTWNTSLDKGPLPGCQPHHDREVNCYGP